MQETLKGPSLTVVNNNGTIHSSSITVVVTNPLPEKESPKADFISTLIRLDDTLIVEFDASPSNGELLSYIWDFENSGSQTGQKVIHAFNANKVSTYPLTVTDSSGIQHTKSSSTITFLKQIHAAVVSNINSLLLYKENEK